MLNFESMLMAYKVYQALTCVVWFKMCGLCFRAKFGFCIVGGFDFGETDSKVGLGLS